MSSVGGTAYRPERLEANNVSFITANYFTGSMDPERMRPICMEILQMLNQNVDSSVRVSQHHATYLAHGLEEFSTQQDGYRDVTFVEKAIELREEVHRDSEDDGEARWTNFFDTDVIRYLDFDKLFSHTHQAPWKDWDGAVKRLLPQRSALTRPKPDYAFGISWRPIPDLRLRLVNWKDHSSPATDLFVHPRMAIPFFVLEYKGGGGPLRTAENQIANGMVRAHDILCSLGVEERLHVFGLASEAAIVCPYVSFSISATNDDGQRYCDKIIIVQLKKLDIDGLDGMLKMLRFFELVKNYGQGLFHDTVVEAINAAHMPDPQV